LALPHQGWRYCVSLTGSMPCFEGKLVALDRGHALEDWGAGVNKVLGAIAVKEGLDDTGCTQADTELHVDNYQTLPSAGYKRDLRVAVEAAELGRQRKFLLGYNSQIGHTTAKPGVVCRTLDRRQDYTADEQQ